MEKLTPDDPHHIGPYRLMARLGEGGMGMVYLARSDRGRTVAVKTIRPELASEPDFRQRFNQEITAAQQVGGQWTAPVLDADTEGRMPWVATGYIAGPSLHQVVANDYGPLPERSVLLLAGGLAQALHAIHGAGLVHRDLKPSNVLMTIDGPRVIDFGIARALETNPGEGLTRTGATVGSPGFMSPEQVRGQRLTPASDVFCLGSLLAFAATGKTPFGALDSGVHILMFRIAEETPDLTGLPGDLHQLIAACLHKDPAQRITVEELMRYPAPDGNGEPWLPGALVAQLGRNAVSLLDSESPETQLHTPTVAAPGTPPPSPPPAPNSNPSPYAQPTAPYSSGGFGPASGGAGAAAGPTQAAGTPPPSPPPPSPYSASPYGPQQSQQPQQPHPTGTGGGNSRAKLLAIVVAVVVVVAGGVFAAVSMTGDDDEGGSGGSGGSGGGGGGGSAIAEDYLGAWQGEYGERGTSGWRAMRVEIQQGAPGDTIGTVAVTSQDVLCVYDMQLASFDQQLTFTETSRSAVPESAVQDTCRDNNDEQTLTLNDSGQMQWSYNQQSATLQAAPAGDQLVPQNLLGTWVDDYVNRRDDVEMRDTAVVEQGTTGDPVLTFSITDFINTCTWQNRLVQAEQDRILVGPDSLVEAESDAGCNTGVAFWVYEEGGVLYFQLTNDPDGNPYPVEPN